MLIKKKPVLGLTLGDIGGIGPEVLFKALNKLSKDKSFIPVVFGSYNSLPYFGFDSRLVQSIKRVKILDRSQLVCGNIYFYDLTEAGLPFSKGNPSAENGLLSYIYIKRAAEYAVEKKIDAIVTAPICKESLALADIPFSGHTTMLASISKASSVSMAFYTKRLKTVLTTVHVPYKDVPHLLTREKLRTAIDNSLVMAEYLAIKNPRIAIAGLNPHAGENGLFGREEKDILTPVIEEYMNKGLSISGPFPADTVYYRAYHNDFDIVVSLFHDQGLIPIKLLAFDRAVNVTLGLPFIRTSPDHGTAFGIAGKDKASPNSMIEAIKLAIRFCRNTSLV
ncbi:4-hydroxythreonine-4-phosphate dehydrogenase PdxA [Candidatus Margulisiibacteriota bacterium]